MALDYTSYQTEDFVLDDSFQAFVTGADATAVAFWQSWLAAHPAQAPAAEQARLLVLALSQARQPVVAAQFKQQDLLRLQQTIRRPLPAPRLQRQWLQRRTRVLLGALLVLIALAAGGYLFGTGYRPGQTQYATQVGQQRTVRLPDGSVAILNGDSRLRTAAQWDAQAVREVWLEGEAYFQVSHLATTPNLPIGQAAGNAKFMVHAGELNVLVLGTRFNVINRPGVLSKVTLNDGKVLVERATLLARSEMLMKPGELVEYAPAERALVKRAVQPALYSGWVQGTLTFRNTPLREIFQLLRDTYGLEISVDDPALLRRTITGTLPNANADVLLAALTKSLSISSERDGQRVRFRARR